MRTYLPIFKRHVREQQANRHFSPTSTVIFCGANNVTFI